VEDWPEIRRLRRAEGMPIKAITRRLGLVRKTATAASQANPATTNHQQSVAGTPRPSAAEGRTLKWHYPLSP
jgi:hypothetical protein